MNKFNSDGVLIVSNLGGGGGGITNIRLSAGTTSNLLSAFTLSNSNNVSFGLNASTVTAIASAIGALGVSTGGNTAGNTRVVTGIDFVIAGSNNITVHQSTAPGGPDTIWITGAAGGGGLTNINVSAGTTSNNLSNLVFSNSNNVSFGLNGSTITATVTVASTQGSINVSAGTTSNLLSALTFNNANGITFGLNASTITASHNGLTSQSTDYHAITLGGNTAGTTTFHATDNRTIFLNGGANITLSGNGSTITIIGAAGGGGGAFTHSYYRNIPPGDVLAIQAVSQGTFYIQRINPLPNIQFDRLALLIQYSNASNSTGSVTVSAIAGIYTRNVSSLSLLASTTHTYAFTFSGTVGSFSQHVSQRNFTIPWTQTLSESDYWVGFGIRTTTAGANASISVWKNSAYNSNFAGNFGEGTNNTQQIHLGHGFYTATTLTAPNSIAFSEISGGVGSTHIRRAFVFQMYSQSVP